MGKGKEIFCIGDSHCERWNVQVWMFVVYLILRQETDYRSSLQRLLVTVLYFQVAWQNFYSLKF